MSNLGEFEIVSTVKCLLASQVWPRKMIPAFFPNFRGEVWITPGKAPTQGAVYRAKQQQQPTAAAAQAPAGAQGGGISVVLGEQG